MNVAAYFKPGGALAQKFPEYEHRPQQVEMAAAVADAIRKGLALMVEAGTGVGKSLAYLIPAFLALHQGKAKRVIISTATKNLQRQLVEKDIPQVQALFDEPLRVAEAVGRSNFISIRRLQVALKARRNLLTTPEQAQTLQEIQQWVKQTDTGQLEEAPTNKLSLNVIRDQIESDVHHCMYDRCPHYKECFYQRMRNQMKEAQVVVINHAYLLALLTIEAEFNKGAIPEFDVLIIDEAHRLEDVATETLGLRVSNLGVDRFLDRLFSPKRRRGLLTGYADQDTLSLVAEIRSLAETFFRNVAEWPAKERRQAKSQSHADNGAFTHRIRRKPPVKEGGLIQGLNMLCESIADIAKSINEKDVKFEIASAGRRCQRLAEAIEAWMSPEASMIHFLTVEENSKKKTKVEIRAAPLDVGPELDRLIYRRVKSVILTSATLTTGKQDGFRYFQERLGLEDCRTLQLDSPFDYQHQAELRLYKNLPNPKESDSEAYLRGVGEEIKKLIELTDGYAFVLFTSNADMKRFAEHLRPWLQGRGHELFVQNEGMDRNEMLKRFKKTPRSVLFGVASFWDGVDVPGPALSNVIIVKLPFDVPSEPIFEARREAYERRYGKNEGFRGFAVRRAVLRTRQAFGRLIRTKTDKGNVAILDPRICTAKYGQAFLDALPSCPTYVDGKLSPTPR